MSSKFAVWLAFVLNFSFAIIEFIFGGLFGSSAILADAVHDLGDALAIGISAFSRKYFQSGGRTATIPRLQAL